jgi:lipopolysaccharide-induced tumor necrosis factor-alpha factor
MSTAELPKTPDKNQLNAEIEETESNSLLKSEYNDKIQTKRIECPNCHTVVWTRIETKNGVFTYMCCFIIAVLGGVLACCYIPFCCKPCKDTYHYCSNCSTLLEKIKII